MVFNLDNDVFGILSELHPSEGEAGSGHLKSCPCLPGWAWATGALCQEMKCHLTVGIFLVSSWELVDVV